jgi:hypothetical protein
MKKVLLAALLIATFGSAANAGVVLSDSFTYPDGPLVNAGSPWALHSGSPGTMNVTNGMLVIYKSSSEDDHAALQGAPYQVSDPTAKVYSSYTIIISNANDLPTTTGDYISHFKGTNTGALSDFGARMFVSRTNVVTQAPVPDGMYRVSIANGLGSTTNSYWGQVDQDLSTGTVYTVVTRFVPSTGLATIWVNPAAESDPSATATDPGSATRTNQFDVYFYAFRQATGAEGTSYVDNLRVGTFFADVAGTNTSPTISSIPKQAIPMNGNTGPISFTVNDAETPNSLIVTASSSNPTLIPNNTANLTLATNTPQNRTITVTPAAGLQGQSVITVSVSDSVNTSFTTFLVTVGTPTVSPIPNQRAYTNTPIPAISFTVNDAESDPITIYGSSSDQTILMSGNIAFGGSGANRTVTLTPESGAVGVTTIHIDVTDGHSTNTVSFTLTMSPIIGVVFSDNFAYTSFLQPNSIYLADGSPWQTASGTAFEMQVTNPYVYLTFTNTEDVAAMLTNNPLGTTYAPSDSVIFYTGFTVNFAVLPSGLGNYFIHFKSSNLDNLNFRCRVFARTNGAAVNGNFRMGISINSSSPSAIFPQDLVLGTTYAVVTRYNSATSESTLWVNPTTESSTSVDAIDSLSTSETGAVGLREDTGIGNLTLGQLTIGTKFSDVLPNIAPNPEAIQFAVIGGKLVLSWTQPAFSLASNNIVTGPYVKIPGATSPYTNTPAGRNFFRLVYP